MFKLGGKVALVTGAARGMGRSHALALAGQGATVAVTDIIENEGRLVAEEINSKGGRGRFWRMDVSNKGEVDRIVRSIAEYFGRLDILVNNAGIFKPKPALELTEDEWQETININLKGQFLVAQSAAKEMMKNKWGRIVNISSISSGGVGTGLVGGAHYTASKGGIIGLTETLAVEWAPLGITVNCVAPGAIDTPMIQEIFIPSEKAAESLAPIPLGRIGKPEEVSPLVVFLASEEASYITGATFYVDGGWLAK